MAATYCTDRDWLRIKVRPTISVASVRLRRILDPLEPRVRQVVRETVRVRRLEEAVLSRPSDQRRLVELAESVGGLVGVARVHSFDDKDCSPKHAGSHLQPFRFISCLSRTGFRGTSEPGCCPGERRSSAVMSRPRKCPEELLERGVRLALESGRPIAHAGMATLSHRL